VRSEPIKVSVSVVVYKPDCDLLQRSLESVRVAAEYAQQRMPLQLQVCLVDNSLDASWEPRIRQVMAAALPGVDAELRISPVNAGYGAGNNLAIAGQQSDFHIVANPDIFLDPDALLVACEYMQAHHGVALLTPQVRGEDGELHYLCKNHPSLFIMFLRSFAPAALKQRFAGMLEHFEMRDRDYGQVMDGVGYPTGCFMFFRTAALHAIGGFDERFFMYLEDADIGRRILQQGDVHYVPTVKIVHRWARGSHRNLRLGWITVQSAFIYWRKWGGIFQPTEGSR
jgi:GT2 family glycosyltransferase